MEHLVMGLTLLLLATPPVVLGLYLIGGWGGSSLVAEGATSAAEGNVVLAGSSAEAQASGHHKGQDAQAHQPPAGFLEPGGRPAAVLWPGDDVWPGMEIDMVEVIHGRAYGAMHWEAGRVTYSVDGRVMGSIDHNLGHDQAHGGTDVVMSMMNGRNDTHLTVYEVSYTPSDDAWG